MRALMLLLACWLAFPVSAQETPEDREYREYVETRSSVDKGTCRLACGTALANCQAKGNTRCQRSNQTCLDECDAPRKPKLEKKQERLLICQQRCDHSAATCAEARPNSADDCDRGRLQCYDRCKP